MKHTHCLKKHSRRVLLIVGAAALVVAVAAGCRGHGHRFMTPERVQKMATWKVNDLLDDLDADDAQRKLVLAIKDRLVEKGLAFHAESSGTHEALVDAWAKPTPDAKALHALVDERIEAVRALAHEAVDASVELHGVLTDAQREQLVVQLREHLAAE